VRFALNPAAGQFHVGDYWVVAARTADASVDTFVDAPPRGIVHHYCQLATLTGLPTPTIGDCRPLWPPAAGEGCCTISVGDGVLSKGQFQNLAAAIASIATGTIPVRVCLLPGNHTVNQTITISRNDVTITGCARASRVAAEGAAFIVAGDGISFENFLLETRATLPAITWTGAGGRIRGLDLNAAGPGIITTNARDFLVLESRIAALPSISLLGQNQIVARTRMRNGGLEIRGGSAGVWVFENHISQGDGNGITLGGARGGEPSPILRNIAIEHNYITGMVESGIAGAAASAAGGGARSGTLGLSITENIIDNCVSERAAARPDGLPHGGIILDSVRRVLVRHNRIESNGNRSKAPVCGVFAARAGGIDVVDNHVLNNGAPPGTIQERRNQGGIVAPDVFPAASAIPSSDPTGAGPAITRLVASPLAARVTGNVVITPGTLALNLQGTGSMQVAGNRLVSQNNPGLPGLDAVNAALKAFATDPELSVGAVLIINFGLAPYLAALLAGQGFNARKVSASFSAGGAAPPPELAGGAIQFSGNQVLLEMRPAAQPNFQVTGVLVVTLDDLIAAANQTESRLAQTFQLFDTMDLAVTARVPDNGYAENIGQCGFSLVSMGFLMSTGVDNQATHCILITGPAARTVNKDNLSLACRLAAAPVFGARAAGGG
ncbi:MAG: right-handed parallel beta-helix repeat-containing protein, partial [Acidobacteria bacterium]|nr:right-handed parallel beta-helix repeat-containing protein [Acidobacteriota bacterium]